MKNQSLASASVSVSSVLSVEHPGVRLCLGISLIAPLYFGLVSLGYAYSSNNVIQDDARLHVVWLQRLIDPALFPNDAIAHYFGATQAIGFKVVYSVAAFLGFAPLDFAKVLPLGLAVITTLYLFWVTLLILPVPLAGTLTTLILNQNIWLKDDLISATPRAFVYPLFAAFLYYMLRGSVTGCLITLGLQGLFYPQMMMVSFGLLTLRLVPWRWRYSLIWLIALVLTVGLLLFFSSRVEHQVGRLISLDEMLTMPEFYPGGRRGYFGVSPLTFAFSGASGLRFPLFPPVILLGTLLPLVRRAFRRAFPPGLTHHERVLGELLLSAVGLFLLAHATFPTLYLPSRYTFYSFRFLMAIASGLVLTLAVNLTWNWLQQRQQAITPWTVADRVKAGLGGVMAIAIITVPAIPPVFLSCHGWIVGQTPTLYTLLSQQPKDTLVASIAPEANNIPAFSQRSVFVSAEYALPYHARFYDLMTQRMTDLLQAQYSPDLAAVQDWLTSSGIDVWMVDEDFAEPAYLTQQSWLVNSSIPDAVLETRLTLQNGIQPALVRAIPSCTLLTEAHLIVLDAHCISTLDKNT